MLRASEMSLVLVLAVLCALPSGLGQSPAPAPELDCTDSLTDLLPCLDFVTNDSPNISAECCSGLVNVKNSSPACLCQFISPDNANSSASLGINVTRALELPGACKVSADPAECGGTPAPTAPSTAPVVAPVPSSPVPPTQGPSSMPSVAPPTGTPTSVPSLAPTVSPSKAPSAVPPPPAADCSGKIAELADCLPYVLGQTSPPTAECCTALGSVVATAPTCLCSLLTGDTSTPAGLNTTLALQLPTYCNVPVDINACSLGGGTEGGAEAPAASAPDNGSPSSPATVLSANPVYSFLIIAAAVLGLMR